VNICSVRDSGESHLIGSRRLAEAWYNLLAWIKFRDSPKSATLATRPSAIRMLRAARSRWIIPLEDRYSCKQIKNFWRHKYRWNNNSVLICWSHNWFECPNTTHVTRKVYNHAFPENKIKSRESNIRKWPLLCLRGSSYKPNGLITEFRVMWVSILFQSFPNIAKIVRVKDSTWIIVSTHHSLCNLPQEWTESFQQTF